MAFSLGSGKAAVKDRADELKALRAEQKKTKDSLKRLDDNVYFLDYKNDYALDKMLEKGVSNVGEILAFASKTLTLGTRKFKLGKIGAGCTTFNAFNDRNEPLLARNFDYKAAPCLVVRTSPVNGYKSLGITDINFMIYGYKKRPENDRDKLQLLLAPYICMDGINEKGLAIGVLEIKAAPTKQETGKKPIATTIMIRTVLDKAANVDEAIELFRQYDMHDSIFCCYHYQLTDASGRSVVIEYVNNEMRIVEAEKPEGAKYAFTMCSNYFITEGGDNSDGMGYDRYEKCKNRLTEKGGVMTENECLDLLHYCTLRYHHQLCWPVITLWSAVYNCAELNLTLCAGMDYDRKHVIALND